MFVHWLRLLKKDKAKNGLLAIWQDLSYADELAPPCKIGNVKATPVTEPEEDWVAKDEDERMGHLLEHVFLANDE